MGGSVFERAAPTYGLVEPDQFSHFAQRLLQRVPIRARARVLDLACGPGTVAAAIAGRGSPVRSLVGVDLAPAMLRRAAAEFRRLGVAGGVARRGAHAPAWPDEGV